MEAEGEFRELLKKRNIDPGAFRSRLPAVYEKWLALFTQVHPESFLALIRNEINRVRRQTQGLPLQRDDERGH